LREIEVFLILADELSLQSKNSLVTSSRNRCADVSQVGPREDVRTGALRSNPLRQREAREHEKTRDVTPCDVADRCRRVAAHCI